MRRRPPTLRIAVFLLLLVGGAIINIALAWGLHAYGWLYSDVRASQRNESNWAVQASTNDFHGWQLMTRKQVGRRWVNTDFNEHTPTPALRAPADVVPAWSVLRDLPEIESATVSRLHYEWAAGWPCVSLALSRKHYRDWSTDTGWILDHDDEWLFGEDFSLPLRAIWPNVAINTLIHALILWLVFIAPFALRRRLRIRRGLCPTCAYDLRAAPADSTACPECGAPRTA